MANAAGGVSGALTGASAGAALGPIGAGVGALAGGLAGLFGGANNDKADAAYQAAIDAYNNVGTPPDLSNPLVLQGFKQAGALTPELLQKLNLNEDKATTLTENPQDKQNQQNALNALQQMSQTGLTAGDRASFNQLRSQTAGDTQAKINQILQQQQMQGKSSGGNSLAAQLSAVQGANQSASAGADRLAQAATQARAGALQNYAGLAGQMRNADYNTQAFNTQNDIARQKFIDQNSIQNQASNVAAQNAANQANLGRQQSIADANATMQNQELQRQVQAQQQEYADALAKAGGLSGAYQSQGKSLSGEAGNQATSTGNMVTAGLGALSSLGKPDSQGNTNWGNIFGTNASSAPSTGAYSSNNTGGTTLTNPGSSGTSQFGGLGGNLQYSHGGEIPGKAKVAGDSPENDTVPIMASPGEIVIPRTFAHDPDLSKAYVNFIHKHKQKMQDAQEAHQEHSENMNLGGMVGQGMQNGYSQGGNVLDANARAHIAPQNFALPGGRYPIEDANHARNALSRVSQNGSPEEQAKVRSAVHSKYPSIGMANGGIVPSPTPNKGAQDFQKGFNTPDSISDMIRNLKQSFSDDNENTDPKKMAFGGMVQPQLGITPGKAQYPGEAELTPSTTPTVTTKEVVMPRNPNMKKQRQGHEILGSLANFLKDVHEMKK